MTVRKNPAITYPVITNPAEIIPSEMNLALSESRQNWISPYLNLPKTESRLIWISPKLNPAYYEFRQKSNPPKFYYTYRPLGTRKWHQNSNWTTNETFLLLKFQTDRSVPKNRYISLIKMFHLLSNSKSEAIFVICFPIILAIFSGKELMSLLKLQSLQKRDKQRKSKAENTVLAGDPNYKEFAPEVSDWYINISSFEDIWKAIRREIGYYCGVTFYSIIIAIIIVKCYISGFTSRETWLTIISLFTGMIRFVKYFFLLFRLIREPGQPNEQLRELVIFWNFKVCLVFIIENKQSSYWTLLTCIYGWFQTKF